MVNLLRRHQQALMLIITILVIIAFVWLYNGTRLDKIGVDRVATIYGKGLSQTDIERAARKAQLAMELGLYDLLQDLGANSNQGLENYVWNSLVLRHEADTLQIAPTDEQVIQAIKQLPRFQTSGAFDPNKYESFLREELPPRGMSEHQMTDLVRDDLRLDQLKKLIGSTTEPPSDDFRKAYEQAYAKLEASAVYLKSKDALVNIAIVDEDLKKAFEQRKDSYKTEEKRRVSYLKLQLSEADSKLTGKERTEKLQQLADKAQEVAQAMLAPGAKFEKVASQFSLKINQSSDFTRNAPDTGFSGKPEIAAAAFALTENDPNSDVLQDAADSSFLILHLSSITPSKPLAYEEAKPQLLETLKKERAQEALTLKAADLRAKILTSIKEGKAFVDAAKAQGLSPETLPPFSPAAPLGDTLPQASMLMSAAFELKDGQLSEFVPTSDGGFLVCVTKRLPVEESQFASDKAKMLPRYQEARRRVAFQEWLRLRRAEARIQVAARG